MNDKKPNPDDPEQQIPDLVHFGRRDFIKSSMLAAGAFMVPRAWAGGEKIKLAIVGSGWWATDYLIPAALQSGQFDIVGLCDINSVALDNAAQVVRTATGVRPQLFSDYREMYNMPGLQAVVVSTPTHWHALQFIDACKKGLHVYLEKPVSYDIREGQAMRAAQAEAQNVVQVSFPRVTMSTNDKVRDYLQSGEAGRILQVKANINWPEGPVVEKEVPSTLDYEAFCGPAERVPFVSSLDGSNWDWRTQHNFSKGIFMDWGIHYIHNVRRVLDLDLPDCASAIGGITKNHSHDNPDHLEVRLDFDGLPVQWSHQSWGFSSPIPDTNVGVFYYGEKATVFAGDHGWKVYSADKDKRAQHGDIRFLDEEDANQLAAFRQSFTDLFSNFAEGIKTRSNKAIVNTLQDSEKTTGCVLYGDIAYRTKSEILIDRNSMDIEGSNKAKELLRRSYRGPYQHPYKT